MTAPFLGSASREILRACWRARGPVIFPASMRVIADELEGLGFVLHEPAVGRTPYDVRILPTQRGLDVGRSLCDAHWAMLWTDLADKLATESSIALVREGGAVAVRIGARARRARHRARVAFLRAYGHVPGVVSTLASEATE